MPCPPASSLGQGAAISSLAGRRPQGEWHCKEAATRGHCCCFVLAGLLGAELGGRVLRGTSFSSETGVSASWLLLRGAVVPTGPGPGSASLSPGLSPRTSQWPCGQTCSDLPLSAVR